MEQGTHATEEGYEFINHFCGQVLPAWLPVPRMTSHA